jgi:hypothetical protein
VKVVTLVVNPVTQTVMVVMQGAKVLKHVPLVTVGRKYLVNTHLAVQIVKLMFNRVRLAKGTLKVVVTAMVEHMESVVVDR